MKKIICLILALTLWMSLFVPAFADYTVPNNDITVSSHVQEVRAEETAWYYRIYNDLLQKRLWSLTYGYWLTDWITIGHV